MSQYIPDLTERFPEGFGGIDLTDGYFPSEGCDNSLESQMWDDLERENQREEEQK